MLKIFSRVILGLTVIITLYGCETVKRGAQNVKESVEDISVRGYMQDKQRVDQEISGKVGNWENAPMAEDPERKMTRKMYFLEFTKEADPSKVGDEFYEVEETTFTTVDTSRSQAPEPKKRFNLPFIGDDTNVTTPSDTSGPSKFVEYKVEKDDTLQKIAKKHYNSYSKWPRIYNANKDQIKDPNFIKPGIVIKIPME